MTRAQSDCHATGGRERERERFLSSRGKTGRRDRGIYVVRREMDSGRLPARRDENSHDNDRGTRRDYPARCLICMSRVESRLKFPPNSDEVINRAITGESNPRVVMRDRDAKTFRPEISTVIKTNYPDLRNYKYYTSVQAIASKS